MTDFVDAGNTYAPKATVKTSPGKSTIKTSKKIKKIDVKGNKATNKNKKTVN